MAKRKKNSAYTKPMKQPKGEVQLTDEQRKEIKEKAEYLKIELSQVFIFALLTADISDNAKQSLKDIQEILKRKIDLYEPNIFKYIDKAMEKTDSAQHFFLKATNKLSNALIEEGMEDKLEEIQKNSDLYCIYVSMFATILRRMLYDCTSLKTIWNSLKTMATDIGIELNEKEPDWVALEEGIKKNFEKSENV
jgi:hypothetical protein